MKARAVVTWIGLVCLALIVWFRAREPQMVLSDPERSSAGAPFVDALELALQAETVHALEVFVLTHPNHPRLGEAQARIEALRHDDAPWQRALASPTSASLEHFLVQFPGHAREAEARELLARMQPRSVFELLAEGAIEVSARGAGIEAMRLELRRHAPHEIAVAIPVGTFFVTGGDAQNMIATRASVVHLVDDLPTEANVAAACANRSRPIPHEDDTFHLELAPNVRELEALAPLLERADASTSVAQAAVWIVTDDADYDALGLLVRSIDGGFTGTRAIVESDAIRALKLCADAGVDIATRRAGADDSLFVSGLGVEQHGVAEWCRATLEQRGFGSTAGEILLHALERVGEERLAAAATRAAPAHAQEVRAAGLVRLALAGDERVRRRAAEVYRALADAADFETLAALARDPVSEVRAIALEGLRVCPVERTFEILAQALTDQEDQVVSAALETLAAVPDPRCIPHLVALARSTQDEWLRARALELAAQLAPSVPASQLEVRAALVQALREGDVALALAAVHGLREALDAVLAPDLIAATRRIDDTWFRTEALQLLQRIGGPAARAEILRFTADRDALVADAAFSCLAQLPEHGFVPLLEELIASGADTTSRQRIAQTVAYLRTPPVHALLRRLASDPDPAVRAAALTSLNGWADANDLELLKNLAADSDAMVRAAAVRACAPFASGAASELLARALADSDLGVVAAALDACGPAPNAALVPALEAAIANGDHPELRSRCMFALVTVRSREAASALWRLQANARDLEFRLELIAQLESTAEESLLQPLASAAAAEPDATARAALERALNDLRARVSAGR